MDGRGGREPDLGADLAHRRRVAVAVDVLDEVVPDLLLPFGEHRRLRASTDERVFVISVEPPADGVKRFWLAARTIERVRPRPDRLAAASGAVLRRARAPGRGRRGRRRPAGRRPRPRQPRGRPAAARRRGARAAAARGPTRTAMRPFRGLPRLREAIAERYRARLRRRARPRARGRGRPRDEDGDRRARARARRARRHDPAARPLLPRLPLGPRARRRRASACCRSIPSAGWQPDLDAAPAAAACFLNFPSNPCAVCAAPGALRAAVAYARAHRDARSSTTPPTSTSSSTGARPRASSPPPGAREVGVELWSMSKSYGMAGWRIGFVSGTPRSSSGSTSSPTTRRVGMLAALQHAAVGRARGPGGERRGAPRGLRAPPRPARRGAARAAGLRGELLRLARAARGADRRASCSATTASRSPRARGSGRAARATRGSRSPSPTRRSRQGIERLAPALAGGARMKIGIVVPFSWSYPGGVVEHAENQADALRLRGHEVKIVMGHDPPGQPHAAPPSAQRPPRRAARGDHPRRPLGRRARERLAAEHRPLAALDHARCARCSTRSASTSSTSTSR